MATAYKPLYISGNETGLVQERQEFLLPNDAYPTLQNMFLWREQIRRKQGCDLLGRLRRTLTLQSLGVTIGAQTTYTFANIFASFIPAVGAAELNKEIEPGSLVITIGAPDNATFTDQGNGTFAVTGAGVSLGSSVNYITGAVTIVITASGGGATITASINYFPGIPVMGLRSRELNSINNEQLIAFDQVYAYIFGTNGFQEFIPGTTWTGDNADFFWSTNYWNLNNVKLFWVTNFSGNGGDPIRYTNGTAWFDFGASSGTGTGLLDVAAGTYLNQSLALLPFRGRLVAFNTWEGTTLAGSIQYPQRIRWAAIGNPLVVDAVGPPATFGAWRDDVRGRGGFLDIPTSEDITAVGFVRDNLVIYCERSTWQLRYTGRSIAPFQIEKVNTELGAESTFSAVQFDTSLVGIGDKGVVECDSYKSERIDIKIPDLVFQFNNDGDNPKRVHGIRDIQQRLAYWTYPYKPDQENDTDVQFPNRRLVYNYENDSWAIFNDSFTCFGIYQPLNGRRWQEFTRQPADSWQYQNYPWVNRPSLFPNLVAGNQQGFVEYLGNNFTGSSQNDITLSITAIQGFTTTPTQLTIVNHNLETNQFIEVSQIPTATGYSSLNLTIFKVVVVDKDNVTLLKYDISTKSFFLPQTDVPATYVGGGKVAVLDNFNVISKKFNFIDQGENIQMGFIDILLDVDDSDEVITPGITLQVYVDYDDNAAVNTKPENEDPVTLLPDTFFNSNVPTSVNNVAFTGISKQWQRVFCPTFARFLTIEWTLSEEQMQNGSQASNVQIDAQIIWIRPAGKQLVQGF